MTTDTPGASDWICLAAAPTFALMALLTGFYGSGPLHMFCSAGSPFDGMVWMYMLMSVFHSAPWLRLLRPVHLSRAAERFRWARSQPATGAPRSG